MGRKPKTSEDPKAQRLSISIPSPLAKALDKLVAQRGFPNRSQALAEMIEHSLTEYSQEDSNTVMAGVITLVYDSARRDLLPTLASIARENIAEVITTQQILLESNYVMEVVVVQGQVDKLRTIRDQMLACKGVSSGRLTLTNKLIPPLHDRQ